MSEYAGKDNGALRVTIREAASHLGVTEAAVRKRIQRGSLRKERGRDGRVYVYLDLSRDMSHPESQVDRDALVEELRDQVHYLRSILSEEREARRRADTIIAQLSRANAALIARVPELEAPREQASPREPSGGLERSAEEPDRAEHPRRLATGGVQAASERSPEEPDEYPVRRQPPLWRKVFERGRRSLGRR